MMNSSSDILQCNLNKSQLSLFTPFSYSKHLSSPKLSSSEKQKRGGDLRFATRSRCLAWIQDYLKAVPGQSQPNLIQIQTLTNSWIKGHSLPCLTKLKLKITTKQLEVVSIPNMVINRFLHIINCGVQKILQLLIVLQLRVLKSQLLVIHFNHDIRIEQNQRLLISQILLRIIANKGNGCFCTSMICCSRIIWTITDSSSRKYILNHKVQLRFRQLSQNWNWDLDHSPVRANKFASRFDESTGSWNPTQTCQQSQGKFLQRNDTCKRDFCSFLLFIF